MAKTKELITKEGHAATLWFREDEIEAIKQRRLVCSMRYGDRTEQTTDIKGGYKIGSIISLLILKNDGEFADFESPVRIVSVETKMMNDLTDPDFIGSPIGQRNKTELCAAFRKYYGEILCNQDLVSIIRFEYI